MPKKLLQNRDKARAAKNPLASRSLSRDFVLLYKKREIRGGGEPVAL